MLGPLVWHSFSYGRKQTLHSETVEPVGIELETEDLALKPGANLREQHEDTDHTLGIHIPAAVGPDRNVHPSRSYVAVKNLIRPAFVPSINNWRSSTADKSASGGADICETGPK
ncbi:hypothetical protein EVAR_4628_1 [Eumeta japonica]|uniref:Uncharacterized protein n=1 Tax=Eumeta variegata TaxID=151549 RepID=A0A4C1SZ98_EUMVA|nr:hypothetical protein EVAR_4628_1 [Eumeta japonica]